MLCNIPVIEDVRLNNKKWATLCLWILKFSGCSEDLSQLVGIPMGFYRSTQLHRCHFCLTSLVVVTKMYKTAKEGIGSMHLQEYKM